MEHQTRNQTVMQIPGYLKFNSLPKQIQDGLLERQRGKGEGFAFKTAGISPVFFLVAAATAWIGIVFYSADDYLWSNLQTIIFGIISLAALYLLLDNLYKLIQWLTSRSECYLLITPHHIIETGFNDVWYWDLDQLITANGVHRNQNGRYASTQVTLSLEQGLTKTFNVKNIETAEEAIEQIYFYKKLFAEATAKNDRTYLDSNDDFIELQSPLRQPEAAAPNRNIKRLLTAMASIILAAGTMFGATSLNNYYDDKKKLGICRICQSCFVI